MGFIMPIAKYSPEEFTKHTWAAFTFQQMIPQRLSFQVHYWSARGSIEAIRRSRAATFVRKA